MREDGAYLNAALTNFLYGVAKPTIATRGEAKEAVAFEHTLTAHHRELPPVYSTPDMIRLMETAAFHALPVPRGG